jgi:hypothetical protein
MKDTDVIVIVNSDHERFGTSARLRLSAAAQTLKRF